MTKLTAIQRDALEKIAEEGAEGICIRYEWTFKIRNEYITRQVRQLQKKGLVDMLAFSGGHAAINITDKGRAALAAS